SPKFVAWFSVKIACGVVVTSSAVHRKLIANSPGGGSSLASSIGGLMVISSKSGSSSDSIGPWWVDCTSSSSGSLPATSKVSLRDSNGSFSPSCQYLSSSMRSTYRSATSVVIFVKPQAISWLCPIAMPGSPEKPKPLTSKGQSALTSAHRRV